VHDTTDGQDVTLKMTGTGVQIAQPGESCVNADCATGSTCTGNVCCDRDCAGGCQVCSAEGRCIDQDNRESCGNGSGVCFGVDKCLLPEGQACSVILSVAAVTASVGSGGRANDRCAVS
jgi:hypothetical protein